MSEPRIPEQGEIWDVYLDPVVGREQGGRRPALVISNHQLNSLPSQRCIVAPLTSRDRGIPLHVPVLPPDGGTRLPSFVLCDQTRSVSHERLKRYRGRVSDEVVEQVIVVLGLMTEQAT